jgi:hypothetical protein
LALYARCERTTKLSRRAVVIRETIRKNKAPKPDCFPPERHGMHAYRQGTVFS